MSADTVVNMAKEVIQIIKDGKPTAEIESSTANAVPQVDDWQTLSDTKGPGWYKIPYSRGYLWPLDDYDHVQIEIVLKWDYGARYKGGGAFIPNVWFTVPTCFVGWPWDVNISMTAQNPTNAGGPGAPLARLPVTVKGTVSSGVEHHHVEWGFVLFGNGTSTIA